MHTPRILLCAALGVTASATVASANGFYVNEHDGESTGRAGAVAASNTQPSSIVFSPGGIAVGEGTAVSISGALYVAKGQYEGEDGEEVETDQSPAFVPSVYATSRVHDMVAVGIGFHVPFGLAISWPDGHPQADTIQDAALRSYFITPSVGLNLHRQVPGLSVGGGVDLVPATVELEQAVIFGETVGTAHLGGSAFGVGGRLGVMYHPPQVRGLKLGAMWRSPVKLDFEGDGDFDIADPYRAQLPPDGEIQTSVTLPMSVWGGAAYSPVDNFELELNVVWLDWSSFDELAIDLPGDAEIVAPEDYGDTVTWRAGAEYGMPQWQAAVRAGYIYDPTPIPATTQTAQLPDINRHIVTVGGSKRFGNYGVHLGLLWVIPGERDASDEQYMPVFKARYSVTAFVPNLSVSGQFGH